MSDFTSALYLGMAHPSDSLRPWPSLSSGVPAALREAPEGAPIASALARLVGTASATLLPSTLHLFLDLFAALVPRGGRIYLDAAAYPVARWGAERACARGVPLAVLKHFDAGALAAALARDARPAVLVSDGFCVGCGRAAPIAAWRELLRLCGGTLVLDDTQAFGVLGALPDRLAPYGRGGGGTLRHLRAAGPDVVWGASLAKGMGVPLAALAGSRQMIERFEDRSETRTHCSPPSLASLRAAERALAANAASGERRRRRLFALVERFRAGLVEIGLRAVGGLFPVQTVRHPDARRLYRGLLDRGVQTVLRRSRCSGLPEVTFVFNAALRADDVDRALDALRSLAWPPEMRCDA